MANGRNRLVGQHLRRVLSAAGSRNRTDKQLLEAFAVGEESAFEALVQRHGPLVLSVCRRVLQNEADADDAFQATFLVLARKSGSTGWQNAIGSWLYQVAYRIALKMRARRARQQAQPPVPRPTTQLVTEMTLGELRLVLDEELQRLPERYRAPLLLCYLQGKTQDEAARELGWSEGALRGCLFRAREILRKRLARRGLTVSAVLFATALSQSMAEASVPAKLAASAVSAAVPFAAGQTVAGLVSTTTLVLSKEVLSAMFLAKLKIAALILLAVGLIGTTAGFALSALSFGSRLNDSVAGAEPAGALDPARDVNAADNDEAGQGDEERRAARPDREREGARGLFGTVTSVNTAKTPHTITVRVGEGGVLLSFDLAGDVKLMVGGKAAAIGELKEGARVAIQFAADNRTVASIQIQGDDREREGDRPREGDREGDRPAGRTIYGAVTAVDATKKTIAVGRLQDGGGVGPATTYETAQDLQILIDRAAGSLAELADCRVARIELAADGKIIRVLAEWAGRDDIRGKVKTIDAAKNQLTLTLAPIGEDREGGVKLIGRDPVFTVAADAKVYINGQVGKLADLKVGQDVIVRASNDTAKAIRAVVTPTRREGAPREGERRPGDGEKPREEKPRDGAPREEKPRDDQPPKEKPRDGQPREEKPRDGTR